MNYEGCVSSVNTTLWTFELDNKITVHMGHLAAHNTEQLLPEVGENVRIYNAHYMINKKHHLEKLFLCEKSVLQCSCYKTYTRENTLLENIKDYDLGISDLLEIDYNINLVDNSIKALTQQSSEQILFEVIRSLAEARKNSTQSCNKAHKCLNKIIPAFTLKTISSCCYIDSELNKKFKGPPWSFGTHSKLNKSDILIGCLQINKRYGIILLYDTEYQMPCLITSRNKRMDKNKILNKLVLINEYRVFTETYRESDTPSLEYILFDIEDVSVLNIKSLNTTGQEMFVEELPDDFPYVHNFKFKLLNKAPVSVNNESKIECWLEVQISKYTETYCAYLGLNAYQVQIAPFLKEDVSYEVYHCQKLKDYKNFELLRVKNHLVSQQFIEKTAIFICDSDSSDTTSDSVLHVSEAIEKIKGTNSISFQGLVSIKKFTPALSSRTQQKSRYTGFGTPGKHTHTLIFMDDTQEKNLLLYLNNWENLQVPLGLIPYMRVCVRNVLPQKNKYLKSCPLTTFEVLGYEPPVFFDTVNLSDNPARGCDKYSFVGLGELLPCNVLIWARILQLYIRSLKIMYKCEECSKILLAPGKCTCGSQERILEMSITLFVHDLMGEALIISKSTELLRLLLGLEPPQWNIWCSAFESVGQYVHNNEQTTLYPNESDTSVFCQALGVSINVVNIMKISNLELKCRKMESSSESNEGMPVWFCTDARRREVVL